jgi:DNA-binding winged helix-turn-helix (wHTH) protein
MKSEASGNERRMSQTYHMSPDSTKGCGVVTPTQSFVWMIYAFGDYELDTNRYELRLDGQPLRLKPKVFDLLAYLAQHPGLLVTKEELHEHLWPEQFISESALTYCMTAARKAVGDNGRVQRMIQTVYGRGYRFIVPVQERLHTDPGANERTPVNLSTQGAEAEDA